MATVTIGGEDYDAYTDVDGADLYLAADVSRYATWAALAEDDKGRAIVSATRLLQRQSWRDGVPSTDDPVLEPVAQATSLLAVDIIAKPAVGDDGSTASNIKLVGGSGVPAVEFFRPLPGSPLPSAAYALLRDLLGASSSADDALFSGTAYGSHNCQRSRFDPSDYGLWGDGHSPVDLGP
jgi:hypothetical protein